MSEWKNIRIGVGLYSLICFSVVCYLIIYGLDIILSFIRNVLPSIKIYNDY